MPWFISALLVYFYAGWCMAEVAAVAPMPNLLARRSVYALLFLLWPVFMPWIPRRLEKQRRKLLGANDA